MSTQGLDQITKRLDSCFKRITEAELDDLEIRSDLARYLCVLVSGYFENAISGLLISHAERTSSPHIAKFVEKNLEKWTNPNSEKIISLFGSFKPEWKEIMEKYLIDERKDHINSLVGLRHAIAHGNTATVTFTIIQSYYETVRKCVDKIEEITQ